MKLKLVLTLSLSLILSTNVYCQVYKHKAKQFAFKTKDNYGRWTKWSEWKYCDILVVTNLDKSTFTIYSKEIQEFDIIKFYPLEYDDDGVETIRLLVVDSDGLRCNIRHRFIKNGYFHSQLYIDYSDLLYVYNLVSN